MKDEIKEINIPENVLVALGDLTNGAMNYYKATETVKVRHNTILDYITNLQEENERLKEELEKADSITQSCIFEGSRSAGKSYRQCLNWLEDYKSRNEKAKSLTNRTIEIIKQQPSGNDEWILERLNGINYCLGGDEEC